MSGPVEVSTRADPYVLQNVIVEAALDDAAGEVRILAAEGALPDGGGLMIVVADEAGDVGVNARDGLAKELVSEVPDVAVPLRAAKRLGMQRQDRAAEHQLPTAPACPPLHA